MNFTGIEFPVKVHQINKFEQLNPTISVNVYIFDDTAKKVQPLRLTNEVKERHIHLLLLTKQVENLTEDSDKAVEYHYCWIKNLSRLISSQVSKHNGEKKVCDRCLNYFQNEEKWKIQIIDCKKQNECEIEMPTDMDD